MSRMTEALASSAVNGVTLPPKPSPLAVTPAMAPIAPLGSAWAVSSKMPSRPPGER